jgi:hypothetical protein
MCHLRNVPCDGQPIRFDVNCCEATDPIPIGCDCRILKSKEQLVYRDYNGIRAVFRPPPDASHNVVIGSRINQPLGLVGQIYSRYFFVSWSDRSPRMQIESEAIALSHLETGHCAVS